MLRRRSPAALRLALLLAVVGVGCREADPAEASPADGGDGDAPAPATGDAAPAAPGHDAPDLQGALAAVVKWGVVGPDEGGSTWEVDPFVITWVVAAVQANGDRWLTPYEASGADGVDVSGWQVRVPDDSPLASLGLKDGDVVDRVGGIPASEVQRVQKRVATIDNQVRLRVYRDEVTITLLYRFEPDLAWSRMQADLGGTEPRPPRAGTIAGVDTPVSGDAPRGQGGKPLPSGGARPGSGSSGKPGSSKPGSSKPGSSKPGSSKPGSSKPGSSKPGSSKPSSGKSSSGAQHVHCSGSTCVVDKPYFDQVIASPSRLQKQATIVPAIRNDVQSGYKLESVKSGSAVSALGFRGGDKITHVNGYDLGNDAEALALYFGLSSTKTFKVRYVRGGAARTKTIRVE